MVKRFEKLEKVILFLDILGLEYSRLIIFIMWVLNMGYVCFLFKFGNKVGRKSE